MSPSVPQTPLHPALNADRLALLWRMLQPVLPQVLDQFYAHLQKNPAVAHILEGHDLTRLKAAQTHHWKGVCTEGINEAYYQRCTRIGLAHARIGLNQHFYCSAYGMVIHFARDLLIGNAKWYQWGNPSWRIPRLRALESLYQLVVIDIAASISAYATALEDKSWEQIHTICSGLNNATYTSNQRVKDSATSIQTARKDSQETTEKLAELVNQSQHIYNILNLIRDVAEQTNLLSLNARIEAARAGDAGRGFSVVAEEVKKLSIRVQQATGDIAKQIEIMNNMASEASQAVQGINTHIAEVGESMTAVDEAFAEQKQAISYIQDRGRATGNA